MLRHSYTIGKNVVGKNLGIYLSCFYVGVTEHVANDFDGYSTAEGDGSSKGMAADVRGDGLGDACRCCDSLKPTIINVVAEMWKLVVVSAENVDDGREEIDGVGSSCLPSYALEEIAVGGGEIHIHKIDI